MIDFTLTNRLLKGLGEHRVLISNSINKRLLHGAIDNFDCIEDMKSGTGSSHGVLLKPPTTDQPTIYPPIHRPTIINLD